MLTFRETGTNVCRLSNCLSRCLRRRIDARLTSHLADKQATMCIDFHSGSFDASRLSSESPRPGTEQTVLCLHGTSFQRDI